MAVPLYTIGLEFETGSFTTVTQDVKAINIFRTLGTALSPLAPGEASIVFDNWAGHYTPANAAGSYTGMIKPHMEVRIRATHSGSEYGVFAGYLDEIIIDPYMTDRSATYRFRDIYRHLTDKTITTSLFIDYRSESVMAAVLSEAEVHSYTVAVLGDTFPFAAFERRSSMNVVQQILESGFYSAYANQDGIAKVENRYVGQTNTPVFSLDNSFYSFAYSLSDEAVFNNVSIQGEQRRSTTSQATLGWIETAITIQASSTAQFFLNYLDPDNFEPTPAQSLTVVNSSDYLANSAPDGSGTDHTDTTSENMTFFGRAAKATVFNGTGEVVYLHKFQVRGFHVERVANVSATADDTSSQNVYGERALSFDNNLIASPDFIQEYADYVLNRYKNPDPANSFGLKNQWPDQLGMDLTDNVNLVEDVTGISGVFVIIGIEHILTTGDSWQHETIYTVEPFRDQEVLILDDPVYGVLDSRRLGL